ncbi:MAG TPA: hypothetical protein VGM44_13270 [Polyangiaceae bacterium]|jgi:hypothetical protein
MRAWSLLLLTAFALANGACTDTSCSRAPDTISVALGDSNGSAVEGNTYHSAPYGGPYVHFPPSRSIVFEHGLAAIPYAMQFWLAFSDHGTLAPSAGNMTEIPAVDDGGAPAVTDQSIAVYNNTCSDFYLWVVAQRSTP